MGQENGAASMREEPCQIDPHGLGCAGPKMPDPKSPAKLATVATTLMPEIRVYLDRHTAKLSTLLASPGKAGRALASCRSKALDGLLTSIFQVAEAVCVDRSSRGGLALAAIGGYGRGLVSLRSGVSICLLSASSKDRARSLAETFLSPLRDAGLSIEHHVLTIDEAIDRARGDAASATSLLDWRHLAGCQAVSDALLARAWETIFSEAELPAFFERLEEEAHARRERHQDAGQAPEPDVKLGLGGLRELDEARWCARARWKTTDFRDLVRAGAIAPEEGEAVEAAAELLWATRNRLHARLGRRCDRLTVDVQAQIARDLGYVERGARGETASVEAFVSDYHQQTRIISRFRERISKLAMPTSPTPWAEVLDARRSRN